LQGKLKIRQTMPCLMQMIVMINNKRES
jgi:hypothetical protein